MIPAVVRWQIVTPDPEASSAFHRALFGWSVDRGNALGYREVRSDAGRGIDGGIWPAPPGAPSFVQLFVEVPDVAVSVARATELGASVVVPVSTLPDGDVMAIVRDPTGVTLGLCALKRAPG